MEASAYPLHAATEERHWWFVARRRILGRVLASLALPDDARLIEFGSGTGGNLPLLSRFGRVAALEPNAEARAIARGRAPFAEHVSALDELSVETRFDAALMLDVLEHLEDPVGALHELRRRMARGAPLVATVPAHQWLFGEHDRYLHHVRRYSRPQLRAHLTRGGFVVEHLSPMNCALFPVAVAARAAESVRTRLAPRPAAARGMNIPSAPLNRLLTEIFAVERFIVPHARLPVGLSLLAIARAP
jgi:SAM-dependent methyltransferase